jgi:hypothetical protein
MGFLSSLFGKRAPDKGRDQGRDSFTEKDTRGTRHDTLSLAEAYWIARMPLRKKDPFVMYTFDAEEQAREALLELPCIHTAEDSQKLICTEVLIFGYYPTEGGTCEALICGDELTHELWELAKASFGRHGGRLKNDLEPETRATSAPEPKAPQAGKVRFVREDRKQELGATLIYRIHKGPDAASAKAFLAENPVSKKLYYIVVETPEGNYCRDINGIYKE